MVATSSLELGIDMGAVDLVIQVEAPPSVASGLQRVGRAGHQVGAVSTGVVLPKYRSDLLTSAVVVQRMRSGAIEELRIPANPLDVAAQQIVACVAMDDWPVADLLATAAPDRPLRRADARGLSRPSSRCSPADTPRTPSPSCARASSGTEVDDVLTGPARRPAAGGDLGWDHP